MIQGAHVVLYIRDQFVITGYNTHELLKRVNDVKDQHSSPLAQGAYNWLARGNYARRSIQKYWVIQLKRASFS